MITFMGQLLLASWSLTPKGYAQCNGQLMSIAANQPLFSLLGTMYGGDGMRTFALPNLQGRTPVGTNQPPQQGTAGGFETITLSPNELPPGSHTHQLMGTTTAASGPNPSMNSFATTTGSATLYAPAASLVPLVAGSISQAGGQGHENRQPFLVLNWLIALTGIFPQRQ